MSQELSVWILFKLVESLESFLLELNGLFQVFFAIVNVGDLDVAVANLLWLSAKSHLKELPSLTKNIQGSFKVFLTQVNLRYDLQNLAIWRMCITKDLFVHLERLFKQRKCILVVSRLHIAAIVVKQVRFCNNPRILNTYFPSSVRICEWYCLVTSILVNKFPFSFSAVVKWSSACSK